MGLFLSLKTAGADNAQKLQGRGKMTTVAATTATDSQAGGKDLMSSLEKETINQNRAC